MGKKSRWEIECEDLLDALGGPQINPLLKSKSAVVEENERRKTYLRQGKEEAPNSGESIRDGIINYTIRIKESQLNALANLALERNRTLRQQFAEEIDMLIADAVELLLKKKWGV